MTITNGDLYATVGRAAVAAWLQTLLTTATGFPVGICEAPRSVDDPDKTTTYPYFVVWPVAGGNPDEQTLAFPDSRQWTSWQVTTVGQKADQVLMAADRARAAIIGRGAAGGFAFDAPATGFSVDDRIGDDGTGGSTPEPAGDFPNQIWSAPERYQLYVNEG